VWVNGRLAFDGLEAWKGQGDVESRVPVSLRAGRNRKALQERARKFLRTRDPAMTVYHHGMMHEPESARLWLARAARLAELGREVESAGDFKMLLEMNGNDPVVLAARARAYAGLKRWDAAADDLARAMGKAVTRPDWWPKASAAVGPVTGLPEEVFDRLAAPRPSDRALLGRRVHDLASRGRSADAVAVQDAAVKLDPSDESAWHVLALLRLQAGDADGYRAACRELVAGFPESSDPSAAGRMITTCLLVPGVVEDPKLIGRWAATARVGYE
jgi:Flp pilus assembly protein TadD